MWQCDHCGETVLDDDSVWVSARDNMSEYVYHQYCWEDVKKTEEWYEDWNGELRFGDGEPSEAALERLYQRSINPHDSDPWYRKQMTDAGRRTLLR